MGTAINKSVAAREYAVMSHFVGIGLVLGFLLPHTSTAFLMVNPLLCLFYQCFKANRVWYRNNLIVVIPIMATLLINIPQGVQSKALLSCITLLLYFFTFPMVGHVKVHNAYFYFILLFILFSQVAYAYDITFFENILNIYYPLSEEDKAALHVQSTINAGNIYDFRLGGIFHNSNQCARYLTFLLAAYLALNSEKSIRSLLPFILLSFYGVLITGSRTGFVIFSLLIIVHMYVDKRVAKLWRTAVVLASVAVFLALTWQGSDTFRGLNVIQGFDDSAALKMKTFAYYLSSENSALKILFGYLDVERFDISDATYHVMGSFDSDYGSIIFSYGFIGFAAILVYFFTIFRKMKPEGKVFFVLLLWMYSSTIIKSYRAVFLFMLLLSVIYSNIKRNELSR